MKAIMARNPSNGKKQTQNASMSWRCLIADGKHAPPMKNSSTPPMRAMDIMAVG